MRTLKLFKALDRIQVKINGNYNYYNRCSLNHWEEIINVLAEFDITFPDKYKINFGDKYTVKTTEPTLGANKGMIYIDDVTVAKIYSSGSNVCDTDLILIIYMDELKSLYDKK